MGARPEAPLAISSRVEAGAEPSYYHADSARSAVALSGSSGTATQSTRMDPWGRVESQSGTSGNRQLFTGHRTDSETDLVYMGARYYHPELGLFLSADSYLGQTDRPYTMQPYAYAHGNPTRYWDSDGHSADEFTNSTSASVGAQADAGALSGGASLQPNVPVDQVAPDPSDWHTAMRPQTVSERIDAAVEAVMAPVRAAMEWVDNNVVQPAQAWISRNIVDPVVDGARRLYDSASEALAPFVEAVAPYVQPVANGIADVVGSVTEAGLNLIRNAVARPLTEILEYYDLLEPAPSAGLGPGHARCRRPDSGRRRDRGHRQWRHLHAARGRVRRRAELRGGDPGRRLGRGRGADHPSRRPRDGGGRRRHQPRAPRCASGRRARDQCDSRRLTRRRRGPPGGCAGGT